MLLWLGMMPATLAVMMNQVVSPYAAFTLSQTAAVLGVVSLAQSLPMLLLALVGGVAADRLPRRLVLIGSQTALGLARRGAGGARADGHPAGLARRGEPLFSGRGVRLQHAARQAYIAELVTRPSWPTRPRSITRARISAASRAQRWQAC